MKDIQHQQASTNPLRDLLDSQPSALDGFLSYEYGLCSPRPLALLQGSFALWEEWALTLPTLYHTGAYREFFDHQPILSTQDLSDDDLLRANQILGLAAHATVHFSKTSTPDQKHQRQSSCPFRNVGTGSPGGWVSERCPVGDAQDQDGRQTTAPPPQCPFASSSTRQLINANLAPNFQAAISKPKENPKSEDRIPRAILEPWKEVNLRLGRPKPTFTYNDYFTLNVVPKNDAPRSTAWEAHGARPPKQTYAKLSCDVQVFGDHTENVFVLVNHDMEYQSTPLIRLCCDAFDCVLDQDEEGLANVLLQMGEVVKTVTQTFLQAIPNSNSANFVDPVGWSKSIGMLIPPILDGEFSMSGLQSSFVHLMDVFLGRFAYNGEIGDLALNERPWLPSLHQEFFRRLQMCSVRQYVCQSNSRALRSSFDRLVRLFASEQGFMGVHRIKTMGFLELGVKTGRTESSGQTAQTSSDVGWQARVWRKVNEDLHEGMEERMRLQTNPAADGFTEAFVQSIEEIGSPGSESYRVTFNIAGAGLTYRAGDRLEVMPANSPQIISRMLKALRVSPMDLAESSLLVTVPSTGHWKEAVARSYEKITGQTRFPIAALLRIMHLRPLTRAIFDSVCDAAGIVGHKIVEKQLRRGKIHDVPELIELLRKVQPGGVFSSEAIHELPGKLCSILPPLLPRLYSIANSPPPASSPSIVSIVISRLWFDADSVAGSQKRETSDAWLWTSNPSLHQGDASSDDDTSDSSQVNDMGEATEMDSSCNFMRSSIVSEHSSMGRRGSMATSQSSTVQHVGVCTSFLLNHSLYRYVPVRTIEEDSFHLPPVDDKNPLVFVALGSGAAPMLSFLEELLDRGLDDCPTQIYFFWGLRYARNLVGMPLLKRALEELGPDRIKICISFSGENRKVATQGKGIHIVPGKKERITTTMKRDEWAKMLASLVLQKGYLYLCGHPMLETCMRSVLETALSTTLGYSPEQSSVTYEQMVADRRIRADCFYSGSVHDPSLPGFTYSDVARHNNIDDLWWVYKDHVYNVTDYLKLHPGGTKIMFDKGGRDATEDFQVAHGPHNLRIESAMIPYRIGNLQHPVIETHAEKKAYQKALDFLSKIVEIRNVFHLDVNIFPGQHEASGIAHSPSMRFKTHEKFITSTVPMLERATIQFCDSLEMQIPCSRLIRMRRTIPAKLTSFLKQIKPLLTNGSCPGNLVHVATELCRIECDFVNEFQHMAVNFVASIESQLEMDCNDERPDSQFALLQKVCDRTLHLIASRLQAESLLSVDQQNQVEVFKAAMSQKGTLWSNLMRHLDASHLISLQLNANDFIHRANDSLSAVYFLVTGTASIEDQENKLVEVSEGAVFGAVTEALHTNSQRNIVANGRMINSVKVTSNRCQVIVLPVIQVGLLKKQVKTDSAHSTGKSRLWKRLKFKMRIVGVLQTLMRKAVIRRSSISAFLSEEICHRVARSCKELLVQAGNRVRESENQDAEECYLLISGSVDAVSDGRVLFTYNRSGHLFGDHAATSLSEEGLTRNATFVATEPSRLLSISQAQPWQLVFPPFDGI